MPSNRPRSAASEYLPERTPGEQKGSVGTRAVAQHPGAAQIDQLDFDARERRLPVPENMTGNDAALPVRAVSQRQG